VHHEIRGRLHGAAIEVFHRALERGDGRTEHHGDRGLAVGRIDARLVDPRVGRRGLGGQRNAELLVALVAELADEAEKRRLGDADALGQLFYAGMNRLRGRGEDEVRDAPFLRAQGVEAVVNLEEAAFLFHAFPCAQCNMKEKIFQ
jgi:hypothetical protein